MPKYIFNKETLTYEVYASSGKLKFLKGLAAFAASVAAAFFYLWVYTSVLGYDLPKTAFLKKTNARLNSRLELLNRNLDSDSESLKSFQSRDNDIYRSVFGMAEIPDEVRNAGFGGVDRYAYLDAVDRTGLLKRTEFRLDVLTKKAYLQSHSFDEIESVAKKAGDMAAQPRLYGKQGVFNRCVVLTPEFKEIYAVDYDPYTMLPDEYMNVSQIPNFITEYPAEISKWLDLYEENIEKVIPSLEALGFLDKDFIARLKAQLTEK